MDADEIRKDVGRLQANTIKGAKQPIAVMINTFIGENLKTS